MDRDRSLSRLLFVALFAAFAWGKPFGRADDAETTMALVQASVPNGHVVSLLPQEGHIWDDRRLPAWRKRVAERLTGSPAAGLSTLTEREIDAVSYDQSFKVKLDAVGLHIAHTILSSTNNFPRGVRGWEIISVNETVRTNEYSLFFDESGSPWLRYMPARNERLDSLRLDRCAGQTIRILSWDDLRTCWESRLETDPQGVRAEMASLAESGLYGDPEWKRRIIDKWLRDTRRAALWPKVVFENAETNAVTVFCNGVSHPIPAKESWTQSLSTLPRDGILPWSFRLDREGWHEEDYDFTGDGFRKRYAPDDRDDIQVAVHSGLLQQKPIPRLYVDSALVPSEALRRTAATGELQFRIQYRGTNAWQILAYNPPSPGDRGGYYEIEPHRAVGKIEAVEGKFWFGNEFAVSRSTGLARGDELRLEGAVRLRPWSSIRLTNPSDRVVTNALSLLTGADEPLPAVFDRPMVLEPGASDTWNLDDRLRERLGSDGGDLAYTLRIESSAAYADPSYTNAVLERVGSVLELAPLPDLHDLPAPPEPETIPWVDAREREKMASRAAAALHELFTQGGANGSPMDVKKAVASWLSDIVRPWFLKDEMHMGKAKIPAEKIQEIRTSFDVLHGHLVSCPGCDDCRAFRDCLPLGMAPSRTGTAYALFHEFFNLPKSRRRFEVRSDDDDPLLSDYAIQELQNLATSRTDQP